MIGHIMARALEVQEDHIELEMKEEITKNGDNK